MNRVNGFNDGKNPKVLRIMAWKDNDIKLIESKKSSTEFLALTVVSCLFDDSATFSVLFIQQKGFSCHLRIHLITCHGLSKTNLLWQITLKQEKLVLVRTGSSSAAMQWKWHLGYSCTVSRVIKTVGR